MTGAGSPTGICVYEGKLLPRDVLEPGDPLRRGAERGAVVPGESGRGGVHGRGREHPAGGAGQVVRPSDVCVAPDGSLMVSDWYDPGVGGHATGDKNLQAGVKGRVYRVAPAGREVRGAEVGFVVSGGGGGGAEVTEQRDAVPRVDEAARDGPGGGGGAGEAVGAEGRAAAAGAGRCTCLRTKGVEEKYVKAGLADADADIRVTALRIARERKMDVLPIVKQMVQDRVAQVRREAAIALRGNKSPEAAAVWAELAAQAYPGRPLGDRGAGDRGGGAGRGVLRRVAEEGRPQLEHPGRAGHRLADSERGVRTAAGADRAR